MLQHQVEQGIGTLQAELIFNPARGQEQGGEHIPAIVLQRARATQTAGQAAAGIAQRHAETGQPMIKPAVMLPSEDHGGPLGVEAQGNGTGTADLFCVNTAVLNLRPAGQLTAILPICQQSQLAPLPIGEQDLLAAALEQAAKLPQIRHGNGNQRLMVLPGLTHLPGG